MHGSLSWVADSHTRELLTSGEKAKEHFRCVPEFSLNNVDAHGSLGKAFICLAKCIDPLPRIG